MFKSYSSRDGSEIELCESDRPERSFALPYCTAAKRVAWHSSASSSFLRAILSRKAIPTELPSRPFRAFEIPSAISPPFDVQSSSCALDSSISVHITLCELVDLVACCHGSTGPKIDEKKEVEGEKR